jgi:hypothetical protein
MTHTLQALLLVPKTVDGKSVLINQLEIMLKGKAQFDFPLFGIAQSSIIKVWTPYGLMGFNIFVYFFFPFSKWEDI